tara:strand:- start:32 stop:505 length:474 start_codon:yes stop_codon:yes gene_type:complete
MDIQVSSNFERLLFDLCDGDGRAVSQLMDEFSQSGKMSVSSGVLLKFKEMFDACSLDDDGIRKQIASTYKATGLIIDPHTATGIHAATTLSKDSAVPVVTLSTAHPSKFPNAVQEAIDVIPQLPEYLSDLLMRREAFEVLPNDLEIIKSYIRGIATK